MYILLKNKQYLDKITIIQWNKQYEDAQVEAYNHCLNNYKLESRWIGFIDVDEQINLKNNNIFNLLKDYENFAGLFIIWVTYGANNQIFKADGLLKDRFTKISTSSKNLDSIGKVIVQPLLMEKIIIHNGLPVNGFDIVNENKQKINNYSMVDFLPSKEKICLHHYYTKSYEEWLIKLKRGCAHSKYQRKYNEFFEVNPEMTYCKEEINLIQKYNK